MQMFQHQAVIVLCECAITELTPQVEIPRVFMSSQTWHSPVETVHIVSCLETSSEVKSSDEYSCVNLVTALSDAAEENLKKKFESRRYSHCGNFTQGTVLLSGLLNSRRKEQPAHTHFYKQK
ncbi:Hypothetical predicted protein [Podarcis lilfordi]|uniref:Uncharacterized protein n=1 Tax=Podarcis lilfordi TaxID=74358 RepID=A0AA35JPF6_9SAUR|nr:Hypothetical predicted protein [Podarcis lilfordi]